MSKVSIIMPVYNAERYLREAIDSVLRQIYTDFELLLINDRSTDHSQEICEEYAQKDSRIVLLKNDSDIHGPGPTRNIGLDHATGEYMYFMDADDWIEDCLLLRAVERMQGTGADIVQFGVTYEQNNGNCSLQYWWKGKSSLTKNEIKNEFHYFWRENRNSLWLYLFRREPIKTIRFEYIIIGEDISYIMDALCKAEIIVYIPEIFYHYRYVEGSTSHRWVESTIECREVMWTHQYGFLKSFPDEMNQLCYAEVAYDNYIWSIYQLSSNLCSLSYQEKRRQLRSLEEHMAFYKYRNIYPLQFQHGLARIKYALVKYHLENVLLLLGPVFLRIVRGE